MDKKDTVSLEFEKVKREYEDEQENLQRTMELDAERQKRALQERRAQRKTLLTAKRKKQSNGVTTIQVGGTASGVEAPFLEQAQGKTAPVVVDFTVIDETENKIMGAEEKQAFYLLNENGNVTDPSVTEHTQGGVPEKAEDKLAALLNEKIAALEQKLVAKAEDEQKHHVESLKAQLAQSKTQNSTAQREADVLVSRLAALEEKLVSTIDNKFQQQQNSDIAEVKEEAEDNKEEQTALESRLAALEAKLLASHSTASKDKKRDANVPEIRIPLAVQANSSQPKVPSSTEKTADAADEQTAPQSAPQTTVSHEQEEEEKEDLDASEEEALLPCQRCSSYIMAADVYDQLCDGREPGSNKYCTYIYHSICLDKEEMAKVDGGFWYCPECTKSGTAPKTLTHFEEECDSDGEPSEIKAGNLVVSSLQIPGKKHKTKRAPAENAKEKAAFSPPNAYLEALGFDDADGYESALSAQSEQLSAGSAFAPNPYGDTPRGPLSSARTPGNLPPWSTHQGSTDDEDRPGTRGAITAMVGPSGLWSARTYGPLDSPEGSARQRRSSNSGGFNVRFAEGPDEEDEEEDSEDEVYCCEYCDFESKSLKKATEHEQGCKKNPNAKSNSKKPLAVIVQSPAGDPPDEQIAFSVGVKVRVLNGICGGQRGTVMAEPDNYGDCKIQLRDDWHFINIGHLELVDRSHPRLTISVNNSTPSENQKEDWNDGDPLTSALAKSLESTVIVNDAVVKGLSGLLSPAATDMGPASARRMMDEEIGYWEKMMELEENKECKSPGAVSMEAQTARPQPVEEPSQMKAIKEETACQPTKSFPAVTRPAVPTPTKSQKEQPSTQESSRTCIIS